MSDNNGKVRKILTLQEIPRRGDFILGIDLGTTSVKTCLLHIQSGDVVQPVNKPSKAKMSHPYQMSNADIQDPLKIFHTLQKCIKTFPKSALERVKHIAICGQMHGIVLWRSGKAWDRPRGTLDLVKGHFSPLYTWQDQRCDTAFLESLPTPDSSLRVSSGYGLATLLWMLRKSPRDVQDFDRAGTIMDFIGSALANESHVKISPQNAASWGYFNTVTNQFNTEILANAGVPLKFLPEVSDIGSTIGQLASEWCLIPPGCNIYVATGDMQSAFRASISDKNECDEAVLSINTSAQLTFLMPSDFSPSSVDEQTSSIEFVPFSKPHKYVAVVACLNGGNVLSVFVETLQHWMVTLGAQTLTRDHIWKRLIELENMYNGIELANNQDVLEVCPRLFGERHDPNLRGTISNITPNNLELVSVIGSMCDGIVNNISSMLSPEDLHNKHGVKKVLASGECLKRHPTLIHAVKRHYGKLCDVSFTEEGQSCIGTALFVLDTLNGHLQQNSEQQ